MFFLVIKFVLVVVVKAYGLNWLLIFFYWVVIVYMLLGVVGEVWELVKL